MKQLQSEDPHHLQCTCTCTILMYMYSTCTKYMCHISESATVHVASLHFDIIIYYRLIKGLCTTHYMYVELLYNGHHWNQQSCPFNGGVHC